MKDVDAILLEEGLEVLFKKLGLVKATQFIHLLSLGSGDSVQEIEKKTEKMSRVEALDYINEIRKKNATVWKKSGLI